jgi:hypothetical protein
MQEEMLTSQEATKAFKDAGLSETTFRQRVRDGIIQRQMPEGRQRGALYPKSQVLAAIGNSAQKPKKVRPISSAIPTVFSQATIEDMPEIAVLLESFYHVKISAQKRGAWILRNPRVTFILRRQDTGQLVGCGTVMPLPEEKIKHILTTQVKPPTLPNEIPLYEPGKHYSLYARAIGVLQEAEKGERRRWAARLITGIIQAIIELGTMGVFIDRVYAQGDTKAGEKALKMIGFAPIELYAPTNRKNFMLDMVNSGSVFAARYRAALNTWREINEDE